MLFLGSENKNKNQSTITSCPQLPHTLTPHGHQNLSLVYVGLESALCIIVSLFRRLFIPPCLCSTMSLLHHVYVSPCLYSTMSLFHHVFTPPCLCSSMSLVHHVSVPPCLYSTMSMFHHVLTPPCLCSTTDRKDLCSIVSLVHSVYVPSCLYARVRDRVSARFKVKVRVRNGGLGLRLDTAD